MNCSQDKKIEIVSDFCDVYEPFPEELSGDIVSYWVNTAQIIKDKEESGEKLTPSEGFAKVTIENIGRNNQKYYAKLCLIE
tara:strand:+ start:859 stop:1101 length:243 start_codon:yes stop_codon:yes gene_type:complete